MRLSAEKFQHRKFNSTMSNFEKLTGKEEEKLKKYESWYFYIKEKREEIKEMRKLHKDKIKNAHENRANLISNSLMKSKFNLYVAEKSTSGFLEFLISSKTSSNRIFSSSQL